jgi:hypothetical protein
MMVGELLVLESFSGCAACSRRPTFHQNPREDFFKTTDKRIYFEISMILYFGSLYYRKQGGW